MLGKRPGLLPCFCFRDTPTPRARKPGVDRRPQRTHRRQPRSGLSHASVTPPSHPAASWSGSTLSASPPSLGPRVGRVESGSDPNRSTCGSRTRWVEFVGGGLRRARPCRARHAPAASRRRHDDLTQQRKPRHRRMPRNQRQAGQQVARPALSPVAGAPRRRGSRMNKVSPGSPAHPGRRRHPLSPCARMAPIPAPQRGPA